MISVNDLVPEKLQQLLLSVVPEFYVVGGAVRDSLALRPQQPHDVDIVVLFGDSGWCSGTFDRFVIAGSTLGAGSLQWFAQYNDGCVAFQRLWERLVKIHLNGVVYDILFAHADNITDVLAEFDYNMNQVAVRSDGEFIVGHKTHPGDALVRLQYVREARAEAMRARYLELGYTGEALAYD